jgi:hypothetical protein
MKVSRLVPKALAAALAFIVTLAPQASNEAPRVTFNNSQLKSGEVYVYDQKPVATRPALFTAEAAQNILSRFRTNYAKPGSPKVVIFARHDVVERGATVSASGQSSTNGVSQGELVVPETEKTATIVSTTIINIHDIETSFSRPWRACGANIVDAPEAVALIKADAFEADSAKPEQALIDREEGRDELSKIADIAVKLLVASRQVTVAGLSGDKTYTVPEIQARAVRLSDSRVIGEVSSAEIMARNPQATRITGVREITEATALALMLEILQHHD